MVSVLAPMGEAANLLHVWPVAPGYECPNWSEAGPLVIKTASCAGRIEEKEVSLCAASCHSKYAPSAPILYCYITDMLAKLPS